MITFASWLRSLNVEIHLWDLAEAWAKYESRKNWMQEPVHHGLNTYGCNTHAFQIDTKKLKLGFWRIKGLEATRSLFWNTRFTTMDRWCFWEALSDVEKRMLIKHARDIRQPHCHECGQRWEEKYE